jgi:hypothetical protein
LTRLKVFRLLIEKETEIHRPGEFAASLELVQNHIESEGLSHRVRLVKGIFPDSAESLTIEKVAFAHLDLDYEAGTTQSLDFLHSRLVPGAIVVLDDYQWHHCPGVETAARFFCKKHPEYHLVATVAQQGLLIKR